MAKLMLVEDDNNLREIYEARLQAEGYNIVTARDGEEALVVAKAELPDLVISDVMMPKISGFEMLDILRNTEGLKDVKVIMLTALGQADDQQRGDKLGADRYLVKSQVTLEDIVNVAHELLGDSAAPATPPEPAASAAPAEPAASTPSAPALTPTPDPAPVPAPEPQVAAEPVAEPPAAPSDDAGAPALVVDEPVATPPADPAAAPATDTAQTAAQEEASMEAKIENFVAGASSEATPPADQPATEAAPTEPTPTPAPAVESADPAAESSMEVQPPTDDDQPSGSVIVVKSDDEAGAESTEDLNKNVQIAGKKVIQPIDASPSRDLDALLAAEEAKEAEQQGPPPPTATIADNETGVTQAPIDPAQAQAQPTDFVAEQDKKEDEEPPKPVDPGSIAL